MDRGKSQSGRGGAKSKITQYPRDFFALGSKSSQNRNTDESNKRTTNTSLVKSGQASTSKVSISERKREGSSSNIPPAKKSKVSGVIRAVSSTPTSAVERPTTSQSQSNLLEHWEQISVDIEPKDFVLQVYKLAEDNEVEKCVPLICGAIKLLKNQKFKPDKVIYLGLLYLVKHKPSLFNQSLIVSALASLLKRDSTFSFKSKGNPAVSVLCANLLLHSHLQVQNWPELFVRLYVEDALGDRIWVDHEECKPFVDNIITAFNTKIPPKSLLAPELNTLTGRDNTSSPLTINNENEESGGGRNTPENQIHIESNNDVPIVARYLQSQEVVEQIVLEAIKEQLNRRQPPETITRNFLRLLSSACGLVEIRIIAVSRLEMWLHSPKLMRPAQELLAYLCANCINVSPRDLEVTAYLTKIRLKTKALINVYLNCLRELLVAHPENLPSMLKHTIYNELSNARNPNNMPMIAVMFQAAPEMAATVLAEIFQDLLLNKDDYLRSLRALLREIVRVLRFDINLLAFCRTLVAERKEITLTLRDFEFKDRMFASIADLICLSIFLGISPQVKEAAILFSRGDRKEIGVLQNYQLTVAKIQKEAVTWLHDNALRLFRPPIQDFVHVLHKVMFTEPLEQYYKVDMWPSEGDRNLLYRLACEVPLLQATLIRLLLIGISKEHPLNAPDTLELADSLIKRAALLMPSENFQALQADKLEIIDLVFNLTAYHYPDNITLPQGYSPPQLAISNLYWKAWIMLLILAAHNPSTFGITAWKKYPMLRTFMEMCITNHYTYPPPTTIGESYDDLKNKELQIAALDKQRILEFETHLAAASTKVTITEQNSLLLSQLIELAPMGEPRQPPQLILDQLGALNSTHKMGHLLCRSRSPDFLLEIIQRQGSFHHMPWLADLVHNSEGALSHLPVQCLCELLISGAQDKAEKHRKHSQVLAHLQNVLTDPQKDYTASYEILEYFLRRLNSFHCASRVQAIKGLKTILSTVVVEDDDNNDSTKPDYWLLKQIPNLPHFSHHKSLMVASLRQACQVETNPDNIASYITFLANQTQNDSLNEMVDLVLDMAQLIVERSTIISAVLPNFDDNNKSSFNTLHSLMIIFCSYLSKAKEPRNEIVAWSESQDHVLITWASGEECTMHILVVHAMIILLTYGPANDPVLFNNLLETWFPKNGELPKAYLVDTSEEALLIPDWLKLRMIRSTVPRLVDAALVNLEPSQLVLFIQSFGIPVSSMTKLLCNLDAAVTVDQNSVDEAVLDKCYMAQLVEVQHRRGATGGNIFVQVLQLHEPKLPDDVEIFPQNIKESFPQIKNSITKNFAVDNNFAINFMNCLFGNIHFQGDKNKNFSYFLRTIGKEINTKNSNLITSLISYINLNLISKDFINKLITNEQYSCPLFRFLTTSKYFVADLVKISRTILEHLSMQSSAFLDILKMFLKKQNPEKDNTKLLDGTSSSEILEKTEIVSLERTIKSFVEKDRNENENLVEAMTKLLLADNEKEQKNKTGLFVDWLAELEMEIIGNAPELQMNLLFSHNSNTNWMIFRPYLLTLLTHRASWQTLSFVVSRLLSSVNKNYDPCAILDFFNALISNPKLWQGRDKFTSKFHKIENILQIKNNEICNLIGYILEEAIGNRNDYILKMESRLPLVTSCLENKNSRMIYIVDYLKTLIESNETFETINLDDSVEDVKESKSKVAQEFLILLYLKVPKIVHFLSEEEKMKMNSFFYVSNVSTSSADYISHNLITALCATPRSKDWGRKSHDFDLLIRKISAVHPILILRQLPLIAIGLKGRTHLDFSVFKSRNHLTLFYQIMGVIELITPAIFEPSHKNDLEIILRSYFSLFENHGHLRELQTIFGRFVSFLQLFMSYDATRALSFLQKYAHLLNDLQIRTHINLRPLRSLMSTISLPNENFTQNSNDGEVLFVPPRPPTPEKIPTNWQNNLNNLPKLSDDELTTILEEIDHLSNRKPQILENVVDQIAPMILVTRSSIRQLAHTLLVRYIRFKPSSVNMASPILSSVIRSLDSENTDIVNSTLEKLPEYVVCLQEHAALILDKAFLLSIKFNMNASPSIIKTINVLNIQSGA